MPSFGIRITYLYPIKNFQYVSKYNQAFEIAYQGLNSKQKEAVDNIDGSVMVVAGPGTGKTQLLAARVGKLLLETDTSPHNILCLTFTDAGVLAMRNRLIEFIGPSAYNVNIYTYHGFSNMVIQDNIEYFGGYIELQKVSDLEQLDTFIQLIDNFDDKHPLKRYKGDIYFDRTRLKNLFSTMKRENWTAETIEVAAKKYHEEMLLDEKYVYKRKTKNFKAGDLKQHLIDKELEKMHSILSASNELDNYNSSLEKQRRYDYDDMILWVLKAFEENNDLLLKYQEWFQYIMVDEYQDTNGSQNNLIYQLASFWEEDPNLFVVGDDDQSIYRFQGANMDNVIDFKNKYSPDIIVLENNYRSGQVILDKATKLINHNVERLANSQEGITKTLVESGETKKECHIELIKYHNEIHEEKGIINKIIELKEQGVPLNKIAVIFRKHRNAANIVKYLETNQIPINVKRKINVLEIPSIRQIISMLEYILAERINPYSADHLLFNILHFSYFELSPKDIGKISIALHEERTKNKTDKRWRDTIAEEETLIRYNVSKPQDIIHVASLIEDWVTAVDNVTIQVLIEKILTESTLLDDVLKSDDSSFLLQAVSTFFDFVKNECTLNPKMDLKELVYKIERMESNGLEIPFQKIVYSETGVNFISAHSAKGLEFEHVFIIRADEKNWVDKKNNQGNFKYPPTLVPSSDKSDVEDDRRLFFVALTRSEKNLYISYPGANQDGKELSACRFIHEMKEEDEKIEEVALDETEIIQYTADLMRFRKGKIKLIDDDLIDRKLKDFTMSVTHLNKYLRCPVAFYFEVILKVPQARSASAGFGSAIHSALDKLFEKIKSSGGSHPDVKEFQKYFQDGMNKFRQNFTDLEFKNLSTYGKEVLEKYYIANQGSWSAAKDYKLEEPIKDVHVEGVPVSGLIDKIVIHDDHFYVVDYKTGKYNAKKVSPASGEELGSDYWRQIVFYHLLIESSHKFNKSMKYGKIDFVEPDPTTGKYRYKDIEVSDFDIDIVKSQLKESYEKIHDKKFTEGCQEDNCRWCNFIADHMDGV